MTHDTVRPALHVGAQQTLVLATAIADPQGLSLAIGFSRTAAQCFHHSPPSPAELEAAIMVVEDELHRVPALAEKQATVFVSAAFIEAIGMSFDGVPKLLSLDQVERLFDLLAALSMGRPASSSGIPDDTEFAATLLILRESMHHLRFESVQLEAFP